MQVDIYDMLRAPMTLSSHWAQVVVPGADMKGLEHDFPEVAKIASGYKEHQSAPPRIQLARSRHALFCTWLMLDCNVNPPLRAAGVAPPQKSRHQSIQTVGGEPLLQFAMTPTRGAEDVYLYEQLIESELCSGMHFYALGEQYSWCSAQPGGSLLRDDAIHVCHCDTGLWVETLKEGQDFKSYCPSVPSSLPPGVDLQYETRTINKIFISNDLQWTNPRSKDSGVRYCTGGSCQAWRHPHCCVAARMHAGPQQVGGHACARRPGGLRYGGAAEHHDCAAAAVHHHR